MYAQIIKIRDQIEYPREYYFQYKNVKVGRSFRETALKIVKKIGDGLLIYI